MSDRIAEIRARVDAATAGPWKAKDGALLDKEGWPDGVLSCCNVTDETIEFIAHAREDVPYLLARISGLERQVEATAEGQRATLDQLVRVTGERDAMREALEQIKWRGESLDRESSRFLDKPLPPNDFTDIATKALAAASIERQGDDGRDDDDGMEPCPNGCLGQWGEGTSGQPVPMYCGQHGCDVESPGMAYKPTEHQQPERAGDDGTPL